MEIKLKSFRKVIKDNSKEIIEHIVDFHISRNNDSKKNQNEICFFCNSKDNLTKEHVIPQWTYLGCTKRKFNTNINGIDQTYNKTVIPACSFCNNERLNTLEVYLNKLFASINFNPYPFTNTELENIIRWLEIIDYKFQVLNARKKFIKAKESEYLKYLKDFPLSVMRPNLDYNPTKVVAEVRLSLKRLTVKSKSKNLNSIQIFKTSNPDFHFFHTMDEFIFIELPQFKVAIFYFYKKTFDSLEEGQVEAQKFLRRFIN